MGIQEIKAAEVTIANANMQCLCSCQPLEPVSENSDSSDSVIDDLIEEFVPEEENPEIEPEEELSDLVYVPGDLLISEFVADPVTGEKEWIEIFNSSGFDIDLTDWILEEGAGQKTVLNGQIAPEEYLVIEKSSLNNSGDMIILKDPDGQIIDQVVYGDFDDGNISENAPATSDPYSVIRVDLTFDTDIDSKDFFVTQTVTKGLPNIYEPLVIVEEEAETEEINEDLSADSQSEISEDLKASGDEESDNADLADQNENPAEESAVTFESIRINEIFPDPSGSDSKIEWLELYNSSDKLVNLCGLTIDDIDGGSAPHKIDYELFIPAKGYLVLSNEDTNVILNNTTDQVRLLDSDGKVIDQVNYDNVVEDWSFAYFVDGWQWTREVTPAAENIYLVEVAAAEEKSGGLIKIASAATTDNAESDAAEFTKATIAQIQELDLKTKVQVQGIVTARPGVFGDKLMYIDGLQIYNSKAVWPEMQEGQLIQVKGKISESLGERRILVSAPEDIMIISENINLVSPRKIIAEEVGEEKVGYLVEIEGELVAKNSSTLVFADEFGEFTVYIKQSTDIAAKIFSEGERLKIIGIVSQNKDEYRIMPRSKDDLLNLDLQELPIVGQAAKEESIMPNDSKKKVISVISWLLLILAVFVGMIAWFCRGKIKEKLSFLKFRLKPVKMPDLNAKKVVQQMPIFTPSDEK